MINWHFIYTGENSGKFNMDFDLHLASICGGEEAFLRLYRWKPYCISLGAGQNFNEINQPKAKEDKIDIVKRPTGGRAILHAEEITYSVIHPININSSPKKIFNEINAALLTGLGIYDNRLLAAGLEDVQPDLKSFYKEEVSAVCFASSAKSEVKFSGKKLIGSAQRKFKDVILQHGSILCGEYHKKISTYLNYISQEDAAEIINQKTTDIKSILNEEVDYKKLISSLKKGFEKYYSVVFETADAEQFLINKELKTEFI